uniref:FAD dependent oxidoreductase domain-containing protein n=1 Tax=Haptolina brevifila TaxID=156173 RepID=A0A7S2CVA8_9EUKA
MALGAAHERLDTSALCSRFPYLRFPDGAEGVWEPTSSGYISARRLVSAQITAARAGGCRHYESEAISVSEDVSEEGHLFAVTLADGRVLFSRRVLVACGAFTNGPHALLPTGEMTGNSDGHGSAKSSGDDPLKDKLGCGAHLQLDLNNHTTQTVHFCLGEVDAARLRSMPSVIAKFPSWWAYVLPPIVYPDGRCVIKLGGARSEGGMGTSPSSSHSQEDGQEDGHAAPLQGAAKAPPFGAHPLPTPTHLINWYRSGGDVRAV